MIRMYRTLNYLEMYDATKVEAWQNPEQVRKLCFGDINRSLLGYDAILSFAGFTGVASGLFLQGGIFLDFKLVRV